MASFKNSMVEYAPELLPPELSGKQLKASQILDWLAMQHEQKRSEQRNVLDRELAAQQQAAEQQRLAAQEYQATMARWAAENDARRQQYMTEPVPGSYQSLQRHYMPRAEAKRLLGRGYR